MNSLFEHPEAPDQGTALLGEIVTWDLETKEVTAEAVREGLNIANLNPDLAKDLRAITAFRRAIGDYKKDRTIDKVRRDEDVVTFQFTGKHLEETKLSFDYECQVTLNTATGMIDCPENPEIEAHARTMFAHAQMHRTTTDVTRLVQTMFVTCADLYSINPRKGVAYFVPEAHRHFSGQVQTFLEHLGGRLLRFPVPRGTEQGNRSVKEAVEGGLTELLRDLEEAADGWETKTRESTMDKAVKNWQALKHKAEAYSEYLGDRQERLLSELDRIKEKLAERIVNVGEMKEAAKGHKRENEGTTMPDLLTPQPEESETPENESTAPGLLPEPETFNSSEFVSGSGNGPELGEDVLQDAHTNTDPPPF